MAAVMTTTMAIVGLSKLVKDNPTTENIKISLEIHAEIFKVVSSGIRSDTILNISMFE
tara:strand:+ start:258 stop:431 length:174 start_codon:yes stop_codon:yes gene_type:complete